MGAYPSFRTVPVGPIFIDEAGSPDWQPESSATTYTLTVDADRYRSAVSEVEAARRDLHELEIRGPHVPVGSSRQVRRRFERTGESHHASKLKAARRRLQWAEDCLDFSKRAERQRIKDRELEGPDNIVERIKAAQESIAETNERHFGPDAAITFQMAKALARARGYEI